jgi:quercetin dioxygenase-like cupin family protein
MAVIISENTIEAQALGDGVMVQHLITPERVNSDRVRTDQLWLEPGAEIDFSVGDDDLAWAHLLEGSVTLLTDAGEQQLTSDHFIFLSPALSARIKSSDGALIFRAMVPDAARFDPDWEAGMLAYRCTDWTNEPVLNSEFDARKRIYMVTPKLSGTKAVKGEMIIYPPGTEAANHHHEGAEHFQVILAGGGTFFLDDVPHKVTAGDTIYIYDNERHYFINDGSTELRFIEYFVPGVYRTVWADNAPVCTWNPTGKDIKGGIPNREIGAHSSAEAHSRTDL